MAEGAAATVSLKLSRWMRWYIGYSRYMYKWCQRFTLACNIIDCERKYGATVSAPVNNTRQCVRACLTHYPTRHTLEVFARDKSFRKNTKESVELGVTAYSCSKQMQTSIEWWLDFVKNLSKMSLMVSPCWCWGVYEMFNVYSIHVYEYICICVCVTVLGCSRTYVDNFIF